ncbi:MAG TPA: IPExxxVDY family protein [Flavobacterium sp.]|jgi:hypothetical protein|nr:IPExxxVDY family protein [Flavobacterium sp.]
MAVLKLHLNDFEEVDFDIIAIHSVLEDYRLAYFINQKLPILLSKSKDEVEIINKDGTAFFNIFEYQDELNNVQWCLIANKNEVIINKKVNNKIFLNSTQEIESKTYLLPELKKVDYFLKIKNNKGVCDIKQIVKKLNTIERIETVYVVNSEKIKSKNNLIF